MSKDPQFGPVLMFGLGGIFVEVLKDVAFRIVPLEPRDARQMVREIKGFPVLEGVRGQPAADLAALEKLILKLSEFVEAHPEIEELDLNPVFAYADGVIAVDARIVDRRAMPRPPRSGWTALFNPRTVAVVGDKKAMGYMWLNCMSTFQGKVYSVQVDPNEIPGIEAMGVPNFKSLTEIPDEIDYVVCAVPRPVAPRIVADCVAKKVGRRRRCSRPGSPRRRRRKGSRRRTRSRRWRARATCCSSARTAWACTTGASACVTARDQAAGDAGTLASSARAARTHQLLAGRRRAR